MTLQPLDENTEIHSSQSGGDELNDNHELQRMMTTVTDMNRIKDDKAGDMFNNDDYSEPILKYDHDKESIRDGNDNRDYYTDQPDKDLCQSTGNMTLQPLEANPEIHSSQAEREESNDNDQLQQMMTTDINTDMDKENNDEVDYGSNDDDNYSEEMQGSDEDKESLYDDKDDYDADASVMQRESMSEEDWNMLMTRRKQLQMELNDDIKQFFGQQELPETKDEIPMDQLWQTLKENLGTKLELLHLPEGQIVNEITAASNAINKATRDFIRENHDPDRQQLAEMFCAKMVKMLEEHIRNFEELRLLEIFSRRGYTELKNARAQYLDVKTDYDKLRKTYSKQVEMMTKQKQKKKLLQGYKTFFQDIQDVLAE
ncbi:uncharacterized protein BX664DRAFT_325412 [Halteromyces radiatus]|uniref:uncharacterized protein n=1 Tax=Halteromyces radiatus TaxID=101107 RepID=UPI00222031CF|nr:uncharacterized protein BX664DRAFT_325412 [Halteromyces radiatus]KAI8097017.1 hypothetical protein BX664DRAFT_325412 [Halteromyces radiatus]